MREICVVRAVGHASRPGVLSVVAANSHDSAATNIAAIVLFPGDISTARELMARDLALAEWQAWSCQDLALLLARRWPSCHTIVVHPPRSMDGFSCYDHWLRRLDETGDPVDGYDGVNGTACSHLTAQLAHLQPSLPGFGKTSPLHVLGFSKGAVVLNQLLAELGGGEAASGSDESRIELMGRVASWVWLDPGLNKEPGPILLDHEPHLRGVASRMRARALRPPPRLAVALTPYQLQPQQPFLRSWRWRWRRWPPLVRRESAAAAARLRFERVLSEEGVAVACEDCLRKEPATLATHFEVLNAFTAPWEEEGEEHTHERA